MLISCMLLCCFTGSAQAQKIRVGYMDYPGFIDKNIDGTYSGYAVEYLEAIGKITGWEYVYVHGVWSEILEKLKRQELDFICSAQWTPQRAQDYEYSRFPIGYTSGLLYTNLDKESLYYNDFTALNNSTIATLHEQAMTPLLQEFARGHHFSYTLKEYATVKDMRDALNRGEVSAMLTEPLDRQQGLKLAARFGADGYYVISYKGSPLIRDVNQAISEIKTNPRFEAALYDKYYGSSAAESDLTLTREEAAFIREAGAIRVACARDFPPYGHRTDDGVYTGIIPDMLAQLEQESGLMFMPLFFDTYEQAEQAVRNGQADMLSTVTPDAVWADSRGLRPTQAYISSPAVTLAVTGDTTAPVYALPRGYWQNTRIEKIRNAQLRYYDTVRQCVEAVHAGQANRTLLSTYEFNYFQSLPRYMSLVAFTHVNMPQEFALGVNKNFDPRLLSILNKVLSVRAARFMPAIIENNLHSKYRYSLRDLLFTNPTECLILLGLIFTALFLCLALYMRSRTSQRRELALKKIDEAKNSFLARMSHEMRTPLSGILGMSEILTEKLPDNLKTYTQTINTAGNHLLTLINDLLDMSYINKKKLTLQLEPCDIVGMLEDLRCIYSEEAKASGLTLRIVPDTHIAPWLVCDSKRLKQVLSNLLSNAIKYNCNGGEARVSVEVTNTSACAQTLRFRVSDQGEGISPEDVRRVLGPNTDERTETIEGIGLGLPISRNIIHLMGGELTVKSAKNRGSEFSFTIALALTEPLAVKGAAAKAPDMHGRHILVAEDNPLNTTIIKAALTVTGAAISTAKNGKEALELFRASPEGFFCLIIMDIRMPEMDGLAATRAIRALPRADAPKIRIIALSANTSEHDVQASLHAGMNEHLCKPIVRKALLQEVAKAPSLSFTLG